MCDEITITVYDAEGKQASETTKTSIRDNVMGALKNSSNADAFTMLVDMLNYGAAAQKYFNYNISDLANSLLTEEQKALGTQENPICNNESTSFNYGGTTCVLANTIAMNLYFPGSIVTSDMRAEITFTHHNKTQQTTVSIAGSDFVKNGSYYVITVDEIVAADGRQPVTCKVINADEEVVAWVTLSLENYVASAVKQDSWLYEVMKYSDSAYNYLHRNDKTN